MHGKRRSLLQPADTTTPATDSTTPATDTTTPATDTTTPATDGTSVLAAFLTTSLETTCEMCDDESETKCSSLDFSLHDFVIRNDYWYSQFYRTWQKLHDTFHCGAVFSALCICTKGDADNASCQHPVMTRFR